MRSRMALVLMFAMLTVAAEDAPSEVPDEMVPEDAPSSEVPDEAPEEETTPQGTNPQGTTPVSPPSADEVPEEETTPQGTTPVSPPSVDEVPEEETTPQGTTPQETTPQGTTPQETTPEGTTPVSPPSADEVPEEEMTPEGTPVSSVVPQEGATPEGTTPASPPSSVVPEEGATPASPPSSDGVPEELGSVDQVWCQPGSDDCAAFGDTNATCVADGTGLGLCECGDGFENPSLGERIAYVCLLEGETQIKVRSVIGWKRAACSSFTPVFASDLTEMLENIYNGTITSLRDKCGSLTVFSTAEEVDAVGVAGLDLKDAIAKEIASGKYDSVAALGVPDSATLSTSAGSCSLPHATATAEDTTGTCNALACEAGYHVAKAPVPVTAPYRCVRDADREIDIDDDDLSSGAIAGITIGVVLFVGLVVAVVVMRVCGNKEEAPKYDPHEPAAEEPVEPIDTAV